MDEMQAFERQVERELHEMVGPIPRFDAAEIAEVAVGAPRPALLQSHRTPPPTLLPVQIVPEPSYF